MIDFDFEDAGAPPARTGVPEFRRPHQAGRPARHSDVKESELFYEGGLEAFVRYLDRSKKPV
jgi:hypothetical protein